MEIGFTQDSSGRDEEYLARAAEWAPQPTDSRALRRAGRKGGRTVGAKTVTMDPTFETAVPRR